MSWSVNAVGRVDAVKRELGKQFEAAKNSTKFVNHENLSVAIAENLVNNELDALNGSEYGKAVRVEASGSATTQNGRVLSSQVSVKVEPIYGFVE